MDFVCERGTPLVQTTGGAVRGYRYRGLDIFKGVPYARARRFHAPEPARWQGTLDATSYGCVCPLLRLGKPSGELLVPHRYWVQDEDCQNLNLWTPACDGARRPVLVWLHGGGYTDGSSIEQLAYEGGALARWGGCVVVSLNHRLNLLGYLDLSDFGPEYENSGNNGGSDIIAALQWLRENVAAFGGDPDNVTVFGQSGGGAKITTLLQTPAADGLYHKAVILSGILPAHLPDARGSGRPCVEAMMRELGVTDVRALETLPYAMLAEAYGKVSPALAAEGVNVGRTPHRNAFYLGDPMEVGFRPETLDVPLVAGSVFGEFMAFGGLGLDRAAMSAADGRAAVERWLGPDAAAELLPLFAGAYPDRNPADLLFADTDCRLPTLDYLRRRAAAGGRVYNYLFDLDFPLEGGRVAWHCADIPFFFHNTDLVPIAQIPGVTQRLQAEMAGALLAFAATGSPNAGGLPAWPALTAGEEATLCYGAQTRVCRGFDRAFLEAFAPYTAELNRRVFQAMQVEMQH